MPTQTSPAAPAPALTTQQQTDLAWITARLAEITPLIGSQDATAKSLSSSVSALLVQHWAAKFPEAESARKAYFAATAANRKKSLADMAVKGAALWAALHQHVLTLSTPPVAAAEAIWMHNWFITIPCGQCKAFYRAWVRQTPPDFSSKDAYFGWTVSLHNAVNGKLEKPMMTVAEATVRWGK